MTERKVCLTVEQDVLDRFEFVRVPSEAECLADGREVIIDVGSICAHCERDVHFGLRSAFLLGTGANDPSRIMIEG
jgi:hypothetical protein